MAKTTGPYGPKGVGMGTFYIFFILLLLILAANHFSGGFNPINPNGPNGVPTLEPYYNPEDYGVQRIIIPTDTLNDASGKKNLQLQTFMVNTCGQKTAIEFVVDTSGSMEDDNKMEKTKAALTAFTKQLGGKTAIGMITFSKDVKEVVPLSFYKDIKTKIPSAISDMKPDGWTRTRDALSLARQKLADAISQNKFPDYKYSLVLITDGVPEIPPPNGTDTRDCYVRVDDPITAPAKRCFAKQQDPRIPTNLAQEIRNLDTKGVDIYSVGVYSQNSSDLQLKTYLEPLLKEVANTPNEPYYYGSIEGNNLQKIFDNVINKICEAQNLM